VIRAALGAAWLMSAAPALADYRWDLPPGFPEPPVPADNPMSDAKVALGLALFGDSRLSATGAYSCASCHRPELAFTDGLPSAVGATGQLHARNTPSLFNVAYNASFGWSDPNTRTLEAQHLIPMYNTEPVELGLNEEQVARLLDQLLSDQRTYRQLRRAFPELERQALGLQHVVQALASYVRSLVVADSAFDRYLFFDEDTLTASAKRGMRLFFSERLGCSLCHASFNLSGPVRSTLAPDIDPVFHNTGLYDLGDGRYPDPGAAAHTGRAEDTGAFRAPSLRNVALTAPYMHDGSVATLPEVLSIYAAGGRAIEAGDTAGDGRLNPFKRREVSGFEFSNEEREALLAFLLALTTRSLPKDGTDAARGVDD
jgi:cytochrome c peroxidase